jgi:hypothetical protein
MWSYGGFSGGFVASSAYVAGPPMPAFGYGYGYWGPPKPLGFYSGWFGFHDHWAGYMGWMEHQDYCVWHGWQQMLGGMSIGVGEQRNLLEGMLQQEHGDMSRRELRELTERILKLNKELGAGDDGRVKEITETTTTTTTTTTSTVTQQQRYDTANDFLQLLTSSGGVDFTLEQAKQKADDIRQGRQDTFVTTHLESKTAKQQAIQAPPQQQIQPPPPVQQAPPQQPPVQTPQNVYSLPPPQTQQFAGQNQQFTSQQTTMSPQQQVQVQSPLPVAQNQQFVSQQSIMSPYQQPQVQLPPPVAQNPQPIYSPLPQPQSAQVQQQQYTSQQSQANLQTPAPQTHQFFQSTQPTPFQPLNQGGSGYNQQLSTIHYSQPYQSLSPNANDMVTTSTSTTTTTTDILTSAMHGMSLGQPNQSQAQSSTPQQQYASQLMAQNPMTQHQYNHNSLTLDMQANKAHRLPISPIPSLSKPLQLNPKRHCLLQTSVSRQSMPIRYPAPTSSSRCSKCNIRR